MSGRVCVAYADRDIGEMAHVAMSVINKSPVRNPGAHRLVTYLPIHPEELIVDMNFVGKGSGPKNSLGWEESADRYFQALYERDPELFTGEANRAAVVGGKVRGAVFVDEQWAQKYPQYRPFLGEQLQHHHIGQDGQAVALPAPIHYAYGVIHSEEKQMGVTDSALAYTRYVRERVEGGEAYESGKFQRDYLAARGLAPTRTPQRLIEGAMETHMAEIDLKRLTESQRQALLESMRRDPPTLGERAPESAREILLRHPQCGWGRYTADYGWTEPEPLEKGTRLIQLCSLKDGAKGDYFVLEEDAVKRGLYDPATKTVDARAFSQAAQIAPYTGVDLNTSYMPDARIVTVNSAEVQAIRAPAVNNTAYGVPRDGEAPLTQILIPDSQEQERSGRLMETEVLGTQNRALTDEEAAARFKGAEIQEQYDQLLVRMHERSLAEGQGKPATAEERSRADSRDFNIDQAGASLKEAGGSAPNPDTLRNIDYLRAKHEAYARGDSSFEKNEAAEAKVSLFYDQYRAQGQAWQDALARGEKGAVNAQTQLERRDAVMKGLGETSAGPEESAAEKAGAIAEKGVEAVAGPEAAAAGAVMKQAEEAMARGEKGAMEKAAPEQDGAREEKAAMEKAAPEQDGAREEKDAMEKAAPEQDGARGEKGAMEKAAPEQDGAREEKAAMEKAAPGKTQEESFARPGQEQNEAPSLGE